MTIGKTYRRLVRKSGTKKYARKAYKATGLVNPIKRGRISSTRLFKDVANLKRMINAEKKETLGASVSNTVGQVNGDGYGVYLTDVTPIISQGITGQTRNGNSLKVHSMIIQGQFIQQGNAHSQCKIKVELFLNKGTPIASVNVADIYQLNPVTTMYDYNSPREIDTYKNWVVLCRRTYNIKQDNYSGVAGWRDFKIPLRFKSWHVKYDQTNTNSVTNGQVIMIVTTDSGNSSTTVTSTVANLPIVGVNTGIVMKYFMKYWYYDN